jgi:hypothetical protein
MGQKNLQGSSGYAKRGQPVIVGRMLLLKHR